MFIIYFHTLMCICSFSVPYLKFNAFTRHAVINGTGVHFSLTRGDCKYTMQICRCMSVLANQSESHRQSTNNFVSVTFKAVTNYGFLHQVINQKHVFDCMLHCKTLADIFMQNYKTFLTHSENVQGAQSAVILQEVSCGGVSPLQ